MVLSGSEKIVIALDVGGSSVKNAIVASDGAVLLGPIVTPIESSADAETILEAFAGIIRYWLIQLDGKSPAGIGIGIPSPFDYENGICYIEEGQAKFGDLFGLNIRTALQSRLPDAGLPIAFRNDAEAAILGETYYGAGRPHRRLIGVTLGTGLGSAFVADGIRQIAGKGVPADDGMLFHVLINGEMADGIFSTRGLIARLKDAGVVPIDIKEAAIAARAGDLAARQVFTQFGADLGDFLSPYINDFEAEAVLVLGGIANTFDLFSPALAQSVAVPVKPGELKTNAALLGAAGLYFK